MNIGELIGKTLTGITETHSTGQIGDPGNGIVLTCKDGSVYRYDLDRRKIELTRCPEGVLCPVCSGNRVAKSALYTCVSCGYTARPEDVITLTRRGWIAANPAFVEALNTVKSTGYFTDVWIDGTEPDAGWLKSRDPVKAQAAWDTFIAALRKIERGEK
ncbi:MAG: hypothetical protein GY832_31070 [Chloroflexi bacterium]|nr:hypothetical protein [Chloroflexota bacterium]